MNRQEETLRVFRGVLDSRMQDGRGQGLPQSFKDSFAAVVARISSQRDSAAGSGRADEVRQLTITLADLRDSAGQFAARKAQRNQQLNELLTRVDQSLAGLDRNRARAANALEKANAELDEQMLAFIQSEARRMIVALEKAEQQIAHLYEYLALQDLSGRTP
jgi:septal ring factor EnvC (AmiA/AmiB activator)